ncbi:MAG: flagella basal body P-ring formation protein FlgA [Pseudomonadota bacterium]
MAADPRLKLAECASPLQTSWHGENKTMVQIECAGPAPWRIFVALRSKSKVPVSKATAPLVKRGDPVTVLVRGRGFSVQQAGEAMESGRAGDWIGIRTARETKPVRARIESPGLAVIPAT